MANWNGLVMTDKGIALQSKVQAGEVLNITKLKLGSGTLPAETDIRKLTDLIKPEQNLGIGGREPNGDYCKISATISNVGLEAGYYVRELGVFAQDPDDGEILYAYTTDGAPDYLPAEGGSTVISQEFSVNIAVSDTDKINVEIDPGALATMGYVQLQIDEHNEDASAHEKAFSQHNTDESAHYDMAGATSSKAGKRGLVPAPKAGDQNKVLFGNGQFQDIPLPEIASQEEAEAGADNEKMMTPLRSKQLRDKLTVNGIGINNNDINLNCKFFNSLSQIKLSYSTVTFETLCTTLPANSKIFFFVSASTGSSSYAPNLQIPEGGFLIAEKGANVTIPVNFTLIAQLSNDLYFGKYTDNASAGFSGWKKVMTNAYFATQSEAETGMDSTKLMNPLRVAQAIAKLASNAVMTESKLTRPGYIVFDDSIIIEWGTASITAGNKVTVNKQKPYNTLVAVPFDINTEYTSDTEFTVMWGVGLGNTTTEVFMGSNYLETIGYLSVGVLV